MHPLILLTLASAMTLPVVGGTPVAPDGLDGIDVQDPLGETEASASVQAGSTDLDVRVDPSDLGVYMEASLPGPGFSVPITQPSASTEVSLPSDEAKDSQGWGPAVPFPMPEPEEAAVPAGLAVLGAVAYAAFRWRLLGPWFLMPLYSRLSRSDLLENETRAKLLDVIEGDPGLALQDLADRSGAGWGTTVYHLQRLEQAGFIKSEKQGHHRRFYKVGDVGSEEVEALGMLRNETPRKIAQYLLEAPGCRQKDVCEALDISPSLAHKYLKRLEEQELVTSEREWRSKHYTPDNRLSGLIEQAV